MQEMHDHRSTSAVVYGLIGVAVGLGNVYRFPFTIAKNGGAAALIIYLICLVLIAFPLYFYEMVVGFFVGRPAIEALTTLRPRWLSVSFGQVLMVVFQLGYFSVMTSYSLIFLVGACQTPLPWSAEAQGTEKNTEAAMKYWYEDVLNKYSDEELMERPRGSLGGVQGHLVGAVFVTWFFTFCAMSLGKELVEKVTHYTVIGPIIIMIIMVVTATSLPGAGEGIKFYIGKIDWSAFGKLEVWASCLGQVLFSLGPGFGVGVSYAATLEDPKVNIMKLSTIVAVVNSVFSIFGGFYTFSVVGNFAYETGKTIDEVTEEAGQGLAYVVAPVAMMNFGAAANAMSVLFFLMIFTLGIDSIFGYVETITAFIDGFSHMVKIERYVNRFGSILFQCVICFLTSLPYTTRLGIWVAEVVDFFTNSLGLLFANFFMILALNMDFKYKRVDDTIESTGNYLSKFYGRPTFHFFAPIGSLFLACYLLADAIRSPYGGFNALGLEGLLNMGWALFALLMLTFSFTLWKRAPTKLPPLDASDSFIEEIGEHNHHKDHGHRHEELVVAKSECNEEKGTLELGLTEEAGEVRAEDNSEVAEQAHEDN